MKPMLKWLVPVGLLLAAGLYLVMLVNAEPEVPQIAAAPAKSATAAAPSYTSTARAGERPTIAAAEPVDRRNWREHYAELRKRQPLPPGPAKLETDTRAFQVKIDEELPDRLYKAAAQCYRPGLNRDDSLQLDIRVQVRDGIVRVAGATVTKSEFQDIVLQNCLVDAIRAARYEEPALPDWDEEQQLTIAVRGLKKHLPDDVLERLEAEEDAREAAEEEDDELAYGAQSR